MKKNVSSFLLSFMTIVLYVQNGNNLVLKFHKTRFTFVIIIILFTTTVNAQTLYGKQDIEDLSYAIGITQTQGLKDYMAERLNVDTVFMEAFFKGVKESTLSINDREKNAYYSGILIGQQIGMEMINNINKELFGESSNQSIDVMAFLDGFVIGVNADSDMIAEATQLVQEKMRLIKADSLLEEYAGNKMAGEDYLKEIAETDGIKYLSNGVLYKIVKEGNGNIPDEDSQVKVHYEGRLINGKVFDSSYKNGKPVVLGVNQVIPGFSEALAMMPVGSIWEVYIPQDMGYAERQQGEIEPFSTLIFKIELISIEE